MSNTSLTTDYTWQGREDIEDRSESVRWHQKINTTQDSDVALVGFACDLGVNNNQGRIGANAGPNAIRDALANMAWHSNACIADVGNITTPLRESPEHLEQTQLNYAQVIHQQLNKNSLVLGLGGGHEIAWGSYQGLYQAIKQSEKNIGIINFDAHFDLRKPAPSNSSGTPFRQIAQHCKKNNLLFNYNCLGIAEPANTQALFKYATASNSHYLLDSQCNQADGISQAQQMLSPRLQQIDELYVTICLDALPAHLAPGVSAPSTLGISPEFIITMLQWLAHSQPALDYRWQLCDIAEMNPTYDIDQRTAKLAARLIFEIVKAHKL